MGRKIGVDFGTTNSIISFLPKGGEPQEYERPSEDSKSTKTAVAYTDRGILIGRRAEQEQQYGTPVYKNFKMDLNALRDKSASNGKPALEVAQAFLNTLLVAKENNNSFQNAIGTIDALALTVPAFWDESNTNLGLTNLKKILHKLGVKKFRLLSEPQAAAGYFIWTYKEEEGHNYEGKLLVCDMGGGTFDVSLVNASDYAIKVLFNTGSGRTGVGSAGVAFDMAVCSELIEDTFGASVDFTKDKGIDTTYLTLLSDFERRKIETFNDRDQLVIDFEKAVRSKDYEKIKKLPSLFTLRTSGDITIEVTAQLLFEVFNRTTRPVIDEVLGKLNKYCHTQALNFDHIINVGGFGNFFLVREAIYDYLNLSADSEKIVKLPGHTGGQYAIARGAALVAEEKISIQERIKYDFGIIATYQNENGDKQPNHPFVLVERGTEYTDDAILYVDHHHVTTGQGDLVFRLYIKRPDGEKIEFPVKRRRVKGLKDYQRYDIGAMIDKSKVVHIFLRESDDPKNEFKISFADILYEEGEIIFIKNV